MIAVYIGLSAFVYAAFVVSILRLFPVTDREEE